MSLKDDILGVFTEDMTDEDFAKGIADAIGTFTGACSFVVAPTPLVGTDASPSGAFSGSATVSWQIDTSQIENSIKGACTESMTDADLAQAIADGLDAAAPQWSGSISGTTTVPGTPPTPTPSSDSISVTSTFTSATVNTGLVACFQAMGNMQQGGDEYMATQMAALITAYYTGSVNVLAGASHLSAVQGSITVMAGA